MSVATDVMEAGGLGTFNLEHGFPEAVVRGFRSGFLTDYDYHHLTQVRPLYVLRKAGGKEGGRKGGIKADGG